MDGVPGQQRIQSARELEGGYCHIRITQLSATADKIEFPCDNRGNGRSLPELIFTVPHFD
ncbi:hypothetical protein PILCRDRAFT_813385 [Piloderma croceum F 1598]|uniref:Uncharacterized protein n=1 Tax=Piloderma croceum (strain F 1598) TaxID=765440 RepID=A0A0C3GFM4_PILCF|nr:hypothetical protein PILCRDRAFT_813385 [Piloderma croceum F 1598]